MKRLKSNPESAKRLRLGWSDKKPPKEYRIFVDDAIKAAGGAVQLARLLGITRSAVYQWRVPYRYDPYMPVESAKRLITENPELAKVLLPE